MKVFFSLSKEKVVEGRGGSERVVDETERKGASSEEGGGLEVVRTVWVGSGGGGAAVELEGIEGRTTLRGRRGPLEARVLGRE